MVVLITKQNQTFIQGLTKSKLEFKHSSVNTCTFECSEKVFTGIRDKVREQGLNPYAVMSW